MRLLDIGHVNLPSADGPYSCTNLLLTNAENTRVHLYGCRNRTAAISNCTIGSLYRFHQVVVRAARPFRLTVPYSLLFTFGSDIETITFVSN